MTTYRDSISYRSSVHSYRGGVTSDAPVEEAVESLFSGAMRMGMESMTDVMGEYFAVHGHTGIRYKGIFSEVEFDFALSAGGWAQDVTLQCAVDSAQFDDTTPPRRGDRVTYDGQKYVVAKVGKDSWSFTLYLKGINQ